jgi:phage FluMu gp28-like protein
MSSSRRPGTWGNPRGFSLHRVTLQDALEQGFLHKLQQKLPPGDPRLDMDEAAYFDLIRRGCADEESFQQEYCCVPGADASAWLSHEMIASCEYAAGQAWQLAAREASNPSIEGQPRALFVGVDVGPDHDLTVIWVVERIADVCFTRAVECLRDEPFDAQEAALAAWLEQPAVWRCCIDATGLGRQFCERTQQRHGAARVERVSFTAAVKQELACPVRAAFESRRVRVPAEGEIRADLRAIRKEATAAGNIRFQADRGRNGHADRFWGLALALHAARQAADPGPIRVFTRGRLARVLAERRQRVLW